jgi:hypothetical protein
MSTYLRLGIESEFFLIPRQLGRFIVTNPEDFANFMTMAYNHKKHPALPKMHVDIDGSYRGHDQAIEWSLTSDSSLKPDYVYMQCK